MTVYAAVVLNYSFCSKLFIKTRINDTKNVITYWPSFQMSVIVKVVL